MNKLSLRNILFVGKNVIRTILSTIFTMNCSMPRIQTGCKHKGRKLRSVLFLIFLFKNNYFLQLISGFKYQKKCQNSKISMKYPSIHCEDRRTPHQKSGRKTNVWTEQLGVRQVSLSLIISQVAQVTTEHGQLFFLIKTIPCPLMT